MNEIIKITKQHINNDHIQTVNARELHTFLEVGKDFSNWIKDRIEKYNFVENQDFVCSPILASEGRGGQNRIDYHLSLDMAKELAMVERNEKGKQARQYFIECEKTLVEQANHQIPQTYSDALRLAANLADQNLVLQQEVSEMLPQVDALKRISASEEASTMTQTSKVLGVKLSVLTSRLHAEGWVYRQNESWVAYDRYIKNGCLVYKEATYTDEKTGLKVIKPYCHVTQKGITKLAMLFATKEAA